MGDSAPHKALRLIGTGLVILLPVVLALWFAQLRAKAETIDQLHSFSQLALQKTEMVIREADQARAKASQYRGELCSADHQRYLLHIVRGLLYVEDLITLTASALSVQRPFISKPAGGCRRLITPKSRMSRFTITGTRRFIRALP